MKIAATDKECFIDSYTQPQLTEVSMFIHCMDSPSKMKRPWK